MLSLTNLLCDHAAGNERLRYGHTPSGGVTPRPVVVWGVTQACNLRCVHCYASADANPAPGELADAEGFALLDDLRANRSDKFIRIAYAWLALSLTMLLLLPAYQAAVRIPFSHAYYGAIRHAITVGFVSLMILGMSARFVPAIRGIPAQRRARL